MTRRYFENPELWGRTSMTLVQNQVLNVLRRLCQELPEGARIAEFGCGDGILLRSLQEECPHLFFHGVDLSFEAMRHLLCPPVSRCVADLADLPFVDNLFDLSYCVDVLEHILPSQLQRVVLEVHRVCRGPVLMVSPFLESDAVRTLCPHCGCVFSPYYHRNRFGLDTWYTLIAPLYESRAAEYLPFGLPKPHLPLGMGLPLVSSGNSAVHQTETICPQCDTAFSRSQLDPSADLVMLLAPYAARNRREFGWVHEEMGVLTVPHADVEESEFVGAAGGVLIQTKDRDSSCSQETAVLGIRSAYEIDFGDPQAISLNADLFRSPAYAIDNGRLRRSNAQYGILWQRASAGKDSEDNPLRLVFPPFAQQDSIRLELTFFSQAPGTLQAMLHALPPKPPIRIGTAVFGDSELPASLRFDLPADDDYVTPFGLLVELVWIPSEIVKQPMVCLNLKKVSHIDCSKIDYELEYNTIYKWPQKLDCFHYASISVRAGLVESVVIKFNDRKFNLTGLCPLNINGKFTIPLPSFEHLLEYTDLHKNNIDEHLSKPWLGSPWSGKKVYDALFDRIVQVIGRTTGTHTDQTS